MSKHYHLEIYKEGHDPYPPLMEAVVESKADATRIADLITIGLTTKEPGLKVQANFCQGGACRWLPPAQL